MWQQRGKILISLILLFLVTVETLVSFRFNSETCAANSVERYKMGSLRSSYSLIAIKETFRAMKFTASLNDFSNRWCKRENVEPDALKEWKINIFKIIDTCISFYSRNTHLLPPKPKSSFRHLKRGIQDFHMNYVLVPTDKAANNVVVV